MERQTILAQRRRDATTGKEVVADELRSRQGEIRRYQKWFCGFDVSTI
jgi:hypothetical protein